MVNSWICIAKYLMLLALMTFFLIFIAYLARMMARLDLSPIEACKAYVTDCKGTIIWGPREGACEEKCEAVYFDNAPDLYCVHIFNTDRPGDNPYYVVKNSDVCLVAY